LDGFEEKGVVSWEGNKVEQSYCRGALARYFRTWLWMHDRSGEEARACM